MDKLIGLPAMRSVGVLAGLMVVVAIASLFNQLTVGVAALAMALGLHYASRRLKEIGLDWGVWLAVITTQSIAWATAPEGCTIPAAGVASMVTQPPASRTST